MLLTTVSLSEQGCNVDAPRFCGISSKAPRLSTPSTCCTGRRGR
jgi:hypothetical protein